MANIVLDTNMIVPEYTLEGSRTKTLLDTIASTDHTLYVPEVVIDEVALVATRELLNCRFEINKLRDKANFRRLPRDLQDLIRAPIEADLISSGISYRDTLIRKLRMPRVEVLSYPAVPHSKLIHRLWQMHRPFLPDKDDEGYRDALVWETILELMKTNDEETVFLTSDKGFCNNDKQLHSDLVADLSHHGIRTDRLALFTEWDPFVEMYLSVASDIEEARTRLLSGDIDGRTVHDLALDVARAHLEGSDIDPSIVPGSARFLEAKVREVVAAPIASLLSVFKLKNGTWLFMAQADVTVDADVVYVLPSRHGTEEALLSSSTSMSSHFNLHIQFLFGCPAELNSIRSLQIGSVSRSTSRTVFPTGGHSHNASSDVSAAEQAATDELFGAVVAIASKLGLNSRYADLAERSSRASNGVVLIIGRPGTEVVVAAYPSDGVYRPQFEVYELAARVRNHVIHGAFDAGFIVTDSDRSDTRRFPKVLVITFDQVEDMLRQTFHITGR